MSKAPEPRSIEDRMRDLESSRRRHMWLLILLLFTTCGVGEGRSTDVGYSTEVERLSSEVRRLRSDVEDAQVELQRLSEREPNS